MKNVLILGDSYSTFDGFLPTDEHISWYNKDNENTDVHTVEQTWWHMLLTECNAHLVRNDSWSGTTICKTGYPDLNPPYDCIVSRFDRLANENYFLNKEIDTVIIFGGTNDDWSNAPLGSLQFSDWKDDDLYKVLPALSYLVSRVKAELENSDIVLVVNSDLKEEIVDGFKNVARHYGIKLVILHDIPKNFGHPLYLGMCNIKNQIKSALSL